MEPEKIEPGMANALGKKGAPSIPLQKFVHEGRTVYEWEQTIDEVKVCQSEVFSLLSFTCALSSLSLVFFF